MKEQCKAEGGHFDLSSFFIGLVVVAVFSLMVIVITESAFAIAAKATCMKAIEANEMILAERLCK